MQEGKKHNEKETEESVKTAIKTLMSAFHSGILNRLFAQSEVETLVA